MSRALAHARAMPGDLQRITALCELSATLPARDQGRLLEEAVDIASFMSEEDTRGKALETIAPHLSELKLLRRMLQETRRFRMDHIGVEVLTVLIPRFHGPLLQETLKGAHQIEDTVLRARALIALADYLTGRQKEVTLEAARRSAVSIKRPGSQGPECLKIAVLLAKTNRVRKALDVIDYLEEEDDKRAVLVALAEYLPRERLQEALVAARAISTDLGRCRALVTIALLLQEPERSRVAEEAFASAVALDDIAEMCEATRILPCPRRKHAWRRIVRLVRRNWLNGLPDAIGYMPAHLRRTVLHEALIAIMKSNDVDRVSQCLNALCPYLSKTQIKEVERTARRFDDEALQILVLVALAPALPTDTVALLAHRTRIITDHADQLKALSAVIRHLPKMRASQMFDRVFAMAADLALRRKRSPWLISERDDLRYAEGLVELFPLLHIRQRKRMILPVFELRLSSADFVRLLCPLLPMFCKSLLMRWLERALSKEGIDTWPEFVALLPHISPPDQERVLIRALAHALTIADADTQADRLAEVTSLLAELGFASTVLRAIARDETNYPSHYTIAKLARHLMNTSDPNRQQFLKEALQAVHVLSDSGESLETMAELLPFLDPAQKLNLLDVAGEMLEQQAAQRCSAEARGTRIYGPPCVSPRTLVRLAQSLEGEPSVMAWQRAIMATRLTTHTESRVTAFFYLAASSDGDQRRQLIQEAINLAAQYIPYGGERAVDEILIASGRRLVQAGGYKEALLLLGRVQSGGLRAEGLADLMAQMPIAFIDHGIRQVQSILDQESRSRVVECILSRLKECGVHETHRMWSDLIIACSRHGRAELLRHLRQCGPVLLRLGGQASATGILEALQDVQRWWA